MQIAICIEYISFSFIAMKCSLLDEEEEGEEACPFFIFLDLESLLFFSSISFFFFLWHSFDPFACAAATTIRIMEQMNEMKNRVIKITQQITY